ncbi:aminotransferase class I/II-fold pyridoxal phosphate-dependent enzyme [Methanoculleus chikugoensis]|uniref:aminotransferase class I/II-fold pyridoxal phosphate-dependent enzyme n=1 Tax=Methanoculleus chikugoensis TaxID=118126 RepID=UPI000A6217D5|nr:aminotransferase class I/II-fold pyridoxal phosphate-dependent enzyme [Methanoculleus chikugoensis]
MTLKEEIGRTFGRDAAEVAVGNGSVELIRAFCSAVLGTGDAAYVESPTFAEYGVSVRLAGARCTADENGAAVRFLCNPNNPPTGKLLTRVEVLRLLEGVAGRGACLFLDEAFIELSDPAQSVVDVSHENLFLLRSLTKSFAVPGIRFGYAFGAPELIERVETVRLPWTVNAFAESFAIELSGTTTSLRSRGSGLPGSVPGSAAAWMFSISAMRPPLCELYPY